MRSRNIHVNTKTTKDVLVDKLIKHMKSEERASGKEAPKPAPAPEAKPIKDTNEAVGELSNIKSNVDSFKNKSFVRVSSGAASGNYQVVGRSVMEIGKFLKEVLNIDDRSQPIVNGEPVGPSYILKENDTVEFVKLAGRKG